MMKAIETNEMTIDQANALILQRAKQANQNLVKSTTKNEKRKEFNALYKQIQLLSEEIEQEFIRSFKEARENLPQSNARNSAASGALLRQPSKRNLAADSSQQFATQQGKIRPQSSQSLMIYTQLHR